MTYPRLAPAALPWLALFAIAAACGTDPSAPSADGPAAGDGERADGGDANPADAEVLDGTPPLSLGQGLCSADGFCWENPLPAGYLLVDVWASGPTDVWAVAYAGAILHFDGKTSSQVPLASAAALSAVWGSGPNDVWVAGYEYYGQQRSVIYHFDGKTWTPSDVRVAVDGFSHPNDLWGSGPKDIWAVGDNGGALHYDGSIWTPVATGTALRLRNVVGSASNDVWAVPQEYGAGLGDLVHFDGKTWKTISTGRSVTFSGAWAAGAGDFWVAATTSASSDGGSANSELELLHYDGSKWTAAASPTPSLVVFGMWGSGPHDIWAAGQSFDSTPPTGRVIHYDGAGWTAAVPPTGTLPRALWGSGAKDLWVCDDDLHGLVHYDGAQWTTAPRTSVTDATLRGAWIASPSDVWAVGTEAYSTKGTVVHRTATGWERRDVGAIAGLSAVHGCSASDVWAVGTEGTALHYDGASWTPSATGIATGELSAVACVGPNDVWATGTRETKPGLEAIAVHFDGHSWTSIVPPTAIAMGALWASGPNDVWATAQTTSALKVFHYTGGSSWTPVPEATVNDFTAMSGNGPGDIWIGTLHFDGSHWTNLPSDPHVGLVASWWRGPDDVWAVSAMGQVLHYDGTRFRLVSTVGGSPTWLAGQGSHLFIVGAFGEVLHKAL